LDILVRKYEAREADAAADFYRNIAPMRDAAPLQGHLFERQVLNHLSGISDKCDFPIRRLTDSEETMWTHPGKLTRFNFQDPTDSTFLKGITEAVQERKPMHLIPKAPNFAAVDSILYDPDDLGAAITCIQITRSKNHAIAVSGLQLIQRCFRRDGPLADLRPTPNKKWRFLFVVPSRMESTFKWQTLNGDTERGEWAGKADQYVLGLEDKTIFGSGYDWSGYDWSGYDWSNDWSGYDSSGSDSSVQRTITSQEGEQQVWCWISVFEHC
jgi:hypothetical protein